MQLFSSFLRLIRWPNLLFIALTQTLFYYCIILPHLPVTYYALPDILTRGHFFLLVAASILIAAAGYIINDYFDINIDRVNKPEKMVVERVISRRWAILMHFVITAAGLCLSLLVALHTSRIIILANLLCAVLLWFYSANFKRKLLSGNIIISLLTAWTIIVLYFAVNTVYLDVPAQSGEVARAMKSIFKFAALYAGFAFIISLVREVVKDIEDVEGDAKYSCNTMPIAWGIPAAKVFAGVWMVVLAGAISVIFVYTLLSGWWLVAAYCLFLLIIPLVLVLRLFLKANVARHYHLVSTRIKLIMLAGILSMLLMNIYL